MTLDNLTSGLIGGVIGAVLGVIGAYVISWLDRRYRQRMAGQALHSELSNAHAAIVALRNDGEAAVPFTAPLWLALAPEVAALMGRDFPTVAFAYFHMPRAEAVRLALLRGGAHPTAPEQLEVVMAHKAIHDAMRALSAKLGEPLPLDDDPANPPT